MVTSGACWVQDAGGVNNVVTGKAAAEDEVGFDSREGWIEDVCIL
jgi:hypothetical protein